MSKKRRVTMQIGSLMDPIFKYVVQLNLVANPIDTHGTKILRHIQRQVINADSRVHQPNFQYKYLESVNCRSSILELKFVNGWEKKFYLRRVDMDVVNDQIRQYNHIIEGIRVCQGQDDEPEDEYKTL